MKKSNLVIGVLFGAYMATLPALAWAQAVLEGEMVQVTGSRLAKSMADLSAPAYTLTRSDIEKSSASTVQEALQRIPGVNGLLNSAAMTQDSAVMVRGLQTEVLLLIDGIPYNSASHGAGAFAYDLRSMPLDKVERIEVVKGASSAVYGSHAAGGVINIITKKGAQKSGLVIGAEAGNDGWLKGTVRATAVGQEGLKATVQYVRTQEDERKLNRRSAWGPFDRSLKYRGDDYLLKVEKGYWSFSAEAGRSESEYESYGDLNTDDRTYRRFTVAYDDGVHSARLFAFQSKQDYEAFGAWPSATVYENSTFGGSYSRRFEAGSLSGLWGLELKRESSNVTDLSFSYDADRTNLAPFMEASIAVGEKGVLDLGLRYEHWDMNDQTHNELMPRLSFNWQLDAGPTLYASAGRHFSVPSLYELYSSYGSKDLKPESGWSYDVGIKNPDAPMAWNVGLFYMDMKDKIDFDMMTWKYTNISEYRAWGAEAQIKIPFGEHWSYTQGVGYIHAEEKMEGAVDWSRNSMPRWDLSGVLAYSKGPWTAELEGHYYADRELLSLGSDEYDENFFLANFSLGWKEGNNRLRFAVRNLFDKEVLLNNARTIAPERKFVISYERRF